MMCWTPYMLKTAISWTHCILGTNRIGSVMDSGLASSAVDRGFEPR